MVRRLLIAGVAVGLLLLPVVVRAGEGGGAPGGAGVVTPQDLLLPGGVRMAAYGSEATLAPQRAAEPHSSPARAGVLRVPEDYSTIGPALAAAQAGDVVEVSPGYYEVKTLRISKPITLRGEGGAAETVIAMSGSLQNLLVVNATTGTVLVEGLTFRGWASDYFVKVDASGATVRFVECVFDKGVGAPWNSSVDVLGGSFEFAGNVVMGTWRKSGLSVSSAPGETVMVRDNLFLQNSGPAASVRGGGTILVEGNRVYTALPLTAPDVDEQPYSSSPPYGIVVAPAGEATVANNLVVAGGEGWALSVAPTATATRVDVLHNTLIQVDDGATSIAGAVWLSGELDALHLRSNLIVSPAAAVTCPSFGSVSGSPDVAYNDLVSPGGGVVGCDLANVGANLGVPVAFPGPDFGSYELPADSALVDAADPASPVTTDLAGRARPQDGDGDGTARADIGAYEGTTPAFGFISGTVVDSNPGNPIASECVYAVDAATGDVAAVTMGSADPDSYEPPPEGGAYGLGPLPAGDYRLRVADCRYRGFPDWWYSDVLHPDGIEVEVQAGAMTSGLTLAVPVPETLVVSAVGVSICGQLYTRDGYPVVSADGARPWVIEDIPAVMSRCVV
jgi:hypothetical protein